MRWIHTLTCQLRRWATQWQTADYPTCIYRPMGGKAYWDGPVTLAQWRPK